MEVKLIKIGIDNAQGIQMDVQNTSRIRLIAPRPHINPQRIELLCIIFPVG